MSRVSPILLSLLMAAPAFFGFAEASRAEDLRYPHLERLFQSRDRAPDIVRGGRPFWGTDAPRGAARARAPTQREGRRATTHARPSSAGHLNATAPPSVAAPVVPKTFFVAVIGDAMAMMLADALTESLARERPHVEVMRKGRDNSGVVREDYFDWRKTAREIASGSERIDYALVMMGANDRQPIRQPGGVTLETLSEPWREAYAARVGEIVAAFRARNIPVVWVGLPIMRSEKYGADMKIINAIARVAAEKAGASFVDTWDRFASESGAFEADGPDVNGRLTRLRTHDGIYFTRAGSLKLAHFVENDVARLAGAPPVAPAQPASAPAAPLAVAPDSAVASPLLDAAEIDVNALIRRDASPGALTSELPGVALPETLPPPVFPTRPAAGPVTALTQPPRALDGKLAAAPDPGARPMPSEPKPGRADDFAWPKR